MTSIDFLQKELQKIASDFPGVHIKYGYNKTIETHIVELLPLSAYTNNAALDSAWIPVSIKFMELYKDEAVTFISSDSSLSLKNIIFQFNPIADAEELIMNGLYAPLTEQMLSYTFPSNMSNGFILNDAIFAALRLPVCPLQESADLHHSYQVAA